MTTFTATPWVAENRSVIDSLGRIVAQPIQDALNGDGIEDYRVAKLIAAAPDLLAALEQAVTSMQDSGYPNTHAAVMAARQAIKKATAEGQAA